LIHGASLVVGFGREPAPSRANQQYGVPRERAAIVQQIKTDGDLSNGASSGLLTGASNAWPKQRPVTEKCDQYQNK
jgi:hypothetical protein